MQWKVDEQRCEATQLISREAFSDTAAVQAADTLHDHYMLSIPLNQLVDNLVCLSCISRAAQPSAAPLYHAIHLQITMCCASGEGLHGEQGVRRSSRDKRAPLEYWRNERKVYNREFRSEYIVLVSGCCQTIQHV